MKTKRIMKSIVMMLLCVSLIGCGNKEEDANEDIGELVSDILDLKFERPSIKDVLQDNVESEAVEQQEDNSGYKLNEDGLVDCTGLTAGETALIPVEERYHIEEDGRILGGIEGTYWEDGYLYVGNMEYGWDPNCTVMQNVQDVLDADYILNHTYNNETGVWEDTPNNGTILYEGVKWIGGRIAINDKWVYDDIPLEAMLDAPGIIVPEFFEVYSWNSEGGYWDYLFMPGDMTDFVSTYPYPGQSSSSEVEVSSSSGNNSITADQITDVIHFDDYFDLPVPKGWSNDGVDEAYGMIVSGVDTEMTIDDMFATYAYVCDTDNKRVCYVRYDTNVKYGKQELNDIVVKYAYDDVKFNDERQKLKSAYYKDSKGEAHVEFWVINYDYRWRSDGFFIDVEYNDGDYMSEDTFNAMVSEMCEYLYVEECPLDYGLFESMMENAVNMEMPQ